MSKLWRKLLALSFVAVLLVTATAALANPYPSYTYCDYSLRGGGSLAPDNDIKRWWDYMEVNYGWNFYASSLTGYTQGGHTTNNRYRFYDVRGYYFDTNFSCWDYRNDYPDGRYHDN